MQLGGEKDCGEDAIGGGSTASYACSTQPGSEPTAAWSTTTNQAPTTACAASIYNYCWPCKCKCK